MFKRILAAVATMAIMATLLPTTIFAGGGGLAADVFADLISDITATSSDTAQVIGQDDYQFINPADGETIEFVVDFNQTKFSENVNASKGSIVIKEGQNDTTVKTLLSWDNTAVQNPILDDKTVTWDGKSADSSSEAQAICGSGCPIGYYYLYVNISSPSGAINIAEDEYYYFRVSEMDMTNLKASTTGKYKPADGNIDLTFNVEKNGFVSLSVFEDVNNSLVLVKDVVTNQAVTGGNNSSVKLSWDGKDASAQFVKSGFYLLKVSSSLTSGGAIAHSVYYYVEVEAPANASLKTFDVKGTLGGATFDPSSKGANEDLQINYELTEEMDSVEVTIKNSKGDLMKAFAASTSQKKTGTFTWDAVFALKLVEPGTFDVELTATKKDKPSVTQKKTATVAYNHSSRSLVNDFSIAPTAFDPDFEDSVITFKNSLDANLNVEIRDSQGSLVRKFNNYEGDFYNSNNNHSIAWNGKNTSGSSVSTGTYKAVVITRNDFGVVVKSADIAVNNSGGSLSTNNAHISGISFSPSTKFKPAQDDELKIEFDVEKDIDNLRILAVRGTTQVEIYEEDNIDKENNIETTWDGTDDDDEYVAEGSWKIMFYSKLAATELVAAKSINISYEKPVIDDLYVSKSTFDNDLDEFTSVMFRVDSDSVITLEVLESGNTDDTIVEDMDVVKDTWYSVEWDGGNYDYSDDIDIKLVAKNVVNENVYNTKTISINLDEDDVSSSRANVTNDYISPVVSTGKSEMILSYQLDDDAAVEISIHKGKSSSGSEIVELLSVSSQESGSHEIVWSGKDKNGNTLSDGFYTYKIVSKLKSTDTESGLFVIGKNVDGGSSSSSSSSNGSSNVSSQVISLNGDQGNTTSTNTGSTTATSDCGGFSDVSGNSSYCEAIDWVQSADIFQGYSDGKFKPFKAINRVEVLKVILEAMNVSQSNASGNLGFKDVQIGAWYMPYIAAAKNLGIFSGDAGKGTARPDDTVNRAELLKFVFETLKAADGHNMATCKSNYSDAGSQWYSNYACEAKRYSLYDGSSLYPAALSTRGEVAEVLYRLHKVGAL